MSRTFDTWIIRRLEEKIRENFKKIWDFQIFEKEVGGIWSDLG